MNKTNDTDKCIACSTCVVQCPVAEATSKFLGPRMLGPASERFRLLNKGEDDSLSYCSNCKNCDISCPQGVPVSNINMLARAELAKTHRPSFRDWVLAHGDVESRLANLFPHTLANIGMANPASKIILDKIGISKHADLPKFPAKNFFAMVKKLEQPENLKKTVALYPGCYIKNYVPEAGMDLVWLLNRAGYKVVSQEKFSCCGTPLYTNGFIAETKENVLRNHAIMAGYRKEGIPVLTMCPSCELMFKAEIPAFFPDLENEGRHLLNAEEFLMSCIESGELALPAGKHGASKKIIYHAPCHLRALGIGMPGLELLKKMDAAKILNANAGCCGISGTYGFKKEKYDIAMQIGANLFRTIDASNADVVATECGTCQVQITHGTKKRCMHPVSLLRAFVAGD